MTWYNPSFECSRVYAWCTQTMQFRPTVVRMPVEQKLKTPLLVCWSPDETVCVPPTINAKQRKAFENFCFYFPLHLFGTSAVAVAAAPPTTTTKSNAIRRKAHTVDKIQMKSSSRSNTYVQNVKFRLFSVENHTSDSESAIKVLNNV